MNSNPDINEGPPPELLTAYVDGELGSEDRAELNHWLPRHPEGASEVQAQRELIERWRANQPADLPEGAWAAAWDRARRRDQIRADKQQATVAFRSRILTITAAAALILAVLTIGPTPSFDPPARITPVAPYPVLSVNDVEINGLNIADANALVVGDLPLQETIIPMEKGDFVLRNVAPVIDGALPRIPARPAVAPGPIFVPGPKEGPKK